MCPTRPASCPVNIKPGLTNALIREKNYLQACFNQLIYRYYLMLNCRSVGTSDSVSPSTANLEAQ